MPKPCLERGLGDAALGLLHGVPGDERQQHRGHRDHHEGPAPARGRACNKCAGSAMQHGTSRMALRAASGPDLSTDRSLSAAAGRHTKVRSLHVMPTVYQLREELLAQELH